MIEMGHQEPVRIVTDPDVHDEPHIAGTRITVRQIQTLVEEEGIAPATVAERYDLEVAAVYHALAYYHEHPEEMEQVKSAREGTIEAHRDDAITGPDDL